MQIDPKGETKWKISALPKSNNVLFGHIRWKYLFSHLFFKNKHIFLVQCKLNFIFFASNFDKVYLFKILILVFDQEGGM
jgi:hypothetical protein